VLIEISHSTKKQKHQITKNHNHNDFQIKKTLSIKPKCQTPEHHNTNSKTPTPLIDFTGNVSGLLS
jgi:hypothetical protein